MSGTKSHGRRLLRFAPAVFAIVLVAGCQATGSAPPVTSNEPEAASAAGASAAAVNLDGTYRWTITQEDADKAGLGNDPDTPYPITDTVTLANGELEGGCFGAAGGTYKVEGDRITFHSIEYDYDSTVTFAMEEDGSLRLTPVPPMDPGDAFICFSKTWTKID